MGKGSSTRKMRQKVSQAAKKQRDQARIKATAKTRGRRKSK